MAKRKPPTRPDYIKWLLIAAAVAFVGVMGWYGWQRYYNYRHGGGVTVDRKRFPIAGIDVSSHNGKIDFDKVKDDNYQFVFIKATEGETYRDKTFDRNWRDAHKAGLAVGAYHYFRKNRDGVKQAQNLLDAVRGKSLDLPLVIDIEDDGKDAHVDHATAMQRAKDMVRQLKQNGYHVMIYTNGNGYRQYYKGNFDVDLWLCSFKRPGSVFLYDFNFQQFSHMGSVDGVDGAVDLNVFVGDKQAWQRYLDRVSQAKQ